MILIMGNEKIRLFSFIYLLFLFGCSPKLQYISVNKNSIYTTVYDNNLSIIKFFNADYRPCKFDKSIVTKCEINYSKINTVYSNLKTKVSPYFYYCLFSSSENILTTDSFSYSETKNGDNFILKQEKQLSTSNNLYSLYYSYNYRNTDTTDLDLLNEYESLIEVEINKCKNYHFFEPQNTNSIVQNIFNMDQLSMMLDKIHFCESYDSLLLASLISSYTTPINADIVVSFLVQSDTIAKLLKDYTLVLIEDRHNDANGEAFLNFILENKCIAIDNFFLETIHSTEAKSISKGEGLNIHSGFYLMQHEYQKLVRKIIDTKIKIIGYDTTVINCTKRDSCSALREKYQYLNIKNKLAINKNNIVLAGGAHSQLYCNNNNYKTMGCYFCDDTTYQSKVIHISFKNDTLNIRNCKNLISKIPFQLLKTKMNNKEEHCKPMYSIYFKKEYKTLGLSALPYYLYRGDLKECIKHFSKKQFVFKKIKINPELYY